MLLPISTLRYAYRMFGANGTFPTAVLQYPSNRNYVYIFAYLIECCASLKPL